MAWGKSDEEKAAAEAQRAATAAQKQAQAEAAAQAKAWAAYERTPVGQADVAKRRGDAFFQFEHDVASLAGSSSSFGSSGNRVKTSKRPDILGQIEELGWRLEHVGYVFIETGSTSTNRVLSTGQGTVTRGVVRGIYLFRNVD